jgi:RimJ/RimL family protein N-acetyltransferase
MITTQRLFIRRRRADDIETLHIAKMEVKEDLMRWMSWSSEDEFTFERTQAFVHAITQTRDIYDALLGLDLKTGDFVVACGLREKGPGIYETGYWVAKAYRNKGYASEACGAMIRYAFDHLSARAVVINHFEGNNASRRVIEKTGFTFTHMAPQETFCHALQTHIDVHHYIRHDAKGLPGISVTS